MRLQASITLPLRRLLRLLSLGLALALTLVALLAGTASTKRKPRPLPTSASLPATFIKGGTVSAWNITVVDRVFADARRLGLDTITIPVRLEMGSAVASAVTIQAESLAFAKRVMAREPSFRYIVEPYPWIAEGRIPETDLDPADRAAWFASYGATLQTLGRTFPKAWGLYVASNLVKVEPEGDRWVTLVRSLRGAFKGRLIYRTQWWITADWEPGTRAAFEAKLQSPVFGVVDVIGIAAYFELSSASSPTTDQIKAALRSTTVFDRHQDVFAEVMALQSRWAKPLLLGELSCPALDFGAQAPWDPAVSRNYNAAIQKNFLSAYLETFPEDPARFLGFSLFTIGHPTATTYDLAPSAVEFIKHYHPHALGQTSRLATLSPVQ